MEQLYPLGAEKGALVAGFLIFPKSIHHVQTLSRAIGFGMGKAADSLLYIITEIIPLQGCSLFFSQFDSILLLLLLSVSSKDCRNGGL